MVTVGHVIIDSASKDKERGTALSWQWGLWAPRILPETTKSPPVWPSEPGYGGAKISGDPVQSMRSQGVLAVYHYLRAFSGVDTGAPGIKSNWCIYGIRAIYGWLAV